MSRRTSTSNRRVGFSSKSSIVVVALLLQLAFLAHPTTAIGGWQTLQIFWSRLSGERAQSQLSKPSSSSSNPQVSPIPNGGAVDEDKEDGDSSKKRHVSEVTMTSLKRSSSTPSRPLTTANPAFVPRGRRGGMKLDEKDMQTITFVGRSNPFL